MHAPWTYAQAMYQHMEWQGCKSTMLQQNQLHLSWHDVCTNTCWFPNPHAQSTVCGTKMSLCSLGMREGKVHWLLLLPVHINMQDCLCLIIVEVYCKHKSWMEGVQSTFSYIMKTKHARCCMKTNLFTPGLWYRHIFLHILPIAVKYSLLGWPCTNIRCLQENASYRNIVGSNCLPSCLAYALPWIS